MSANLSVCHSFTLPPSLRAVGSGLLHSASTSRMKRQAIPGVADLIRYLESLESPDGAQLPILTGEPRRVRDLASWLLAHHYVEPLRSPGTIYNAKKTWRRIRETLGDLWVHELDRAAVLRVARRGTESINAMTVKYLRCGLRVATSMGWAVPPRDPTGGLPVRSPTRRAVGATEDVVRDVLASVKSWESERPHLRWRQAGVIRLIVLTGCRVNEICSLRWDAIDLVARRVRLSKSKTGPRTVPLSRKAINELLLLPSRGKSEWVFPSRSRMGPIHPPKAWYEIRKLAGHANLRRHDLRHGFATIAAEQVRIECVQHALGHSNLKQTQHYTGEQLRLGHEASEAVAKRLKGAV